LATQIRSCRPILFLFFCFVFFLVFDDEEEEYGDGETLDKVNKQTKKQLISIFCVLLYLVGCGMKCVISIIICLVDVITNVLPHPRPPPAAAAPPPAAHYHHDRLVLPYCSFEEDGGGSNR